MKLKQILHALLNVFMFIIYNILMYFVIIALTTELIMGTTYPPNVIFGGAILGTLLNPISMYVLKLQIQLGLNNNIQKDNEHRSFYYAAILFPLVLFLISLVFKTIL